jgi:hypothetical protein
MNPVTTLSPESTAAPVASAPAGAPRMDLYVAIHKALRRYMGDTLVQLGRMDLDDPASRGAALAEVDALLATLRAHLAHENEHVHTAIEARQPGAARHTADDHAEHLEAISNLEYEVRALRDAGTAQRPAIALRLYRHLGHFVGENLLHMQVEETQNNALLWSLYSDDELGALHDRLMQSVPPAEMAGLARWFGAALSTAELTLVFEDMQRKAPPEAVDALLGVVRGVLDDTRWARLARALGRPLEPAFPAA